MWDIPRSLLTIAMELSIEQELRRTQPDRVVYVPGSLDGSSGDTGNEHFLVFEGPDKQLMAVWTQSTFEGKPDMRMVFSKSPDGGGTWQKPQLIAGPDENRGTARWGFPLVSKSGRITVLYNRYTGKHDLFDSTCGIMEGVCSDDGGDTWSEPQEVPLPRSHWESEDESIPSNWIVWQKPERLSKGKYFAGFTRWISPEVGIKPPYRVWWANPSVTEFMRFENVDDDPQPRDLKISYFCQGEDALQVEIPGFPNVPVCQEPSLVSLPDGRLFCVMRTTTGHPYYSLSGDEGEHWTQPLPLRQHDKSLPLLHPCSPCPIYRVGFEDYLLFFHNHDGRFGGWSHFDNNVHRRPIWMVRGQFRPEAKQPLWFSEPQFFMDTGGVELLRADLSMYSSTTPTEDGLVFWYPERKFFLLGKHITREWLETIPVLNA